MDSRQVDADVLIAGGGPAGSATAIACARAGLKVIVCESASRAEDRPGETLHPGAEALLAQLGITDELSAAIGTRHPGIFVEWGGPRRFEAFGSDDFGMWMGFQVWRADFDALLRKAAQRAGAEVRTGSRVQAASATADGWRVETASGPFDVHVLVDASGRSRWLERALGVASIPRSQPLVARYGYCEGQLLARDIAPLIVGDAEGWTWTARLRPGLYQWTRVALKGARVPKEWAPAEFATLRSTGPAKGADVTWRLAQRAAGSSWYLVGDAAANLDPTSSHGVLRALLTGIMAGHLIGGVFHRGAPAAEAAVVYHDWLTHGFEADASILSKLYAALPAAEAMSISPRARF